MSTETTVIDLATLAPWGAPRRVQTKNGERNLRKAKAPVDFRALWAANKEALKSAGISWEIDRGLFTGNICWWSAVTAQEQAAAQAAVAMSRATDAEIDVPCPEGMAYLPYQRAGIAFALRVFGDLK